MARAALTYRGFERSGNHWLGHLLWLAWGSPDDLNLWYPHPMDPSCGVSFKGPDRSEPHLCPWADAFKGHGHDGPVDIYIVRDFPSANDSSTRLRIMRDKPGDEELRQKRWYANFVLGAQQSRVVVTYEALRLDANAELRRIGVILGMSPPKELSEEQIGTYVGYLRR